MGVRVTVRSRLDGSEATLDLDQPRIVFGRSASADVPLPHASVSGTHLTLRQQGNGYVVVDERSTNGVSIGGVRLVPERPRGVRSGDELLVGPFVVRVDLARPTAGTPQAEERTGFARRLSHEPASHRLCVRNGSRAGETIELPEQGTLEVGRGEECILRFDDADLSRVHAKLVCDATGARILDADSKNGVEVQGKRTSNRLLRDGDAIRLGSTELTYEDARDRAVRAAVEVAVDEPVPELEVALPEAPPDDVPEQDIVDEEPAPPPVRVKPAESSADAADRLLLALAAAVIAASVVAAMWLFRS